MGYYFFNVSAPLPAYRIIHDAARRKVAEWGGTRQVAAQEWTSRMANGSLLRSKAASPKLNRPQNSQRRARHILTILGRKPSRPTF